MAVADSVTAASGRSFGSLARNTGWNVLGQVLPALVAIAAIPVLIRQLGIERFGFLSLAWVIVG